MHAAESLQAAVPGHGTVFARGVWFVHCRRCAGKCDVRSRRERICARNVQARRSVPVALRRCLMLARSSCSVCAAAAVGVSVPVALAPLWLRVRVRDAPRRHAWCLCARAHASFVHGAALPSCNVYVQTSCGRARAGRGGAKMYLRGWAQASAQVWHPLRHAASLLEAQKAAAAGAARAGSRSRLIVGRRHSECSGAGRRGRGAAGAAPAAGGETGAALVAAVDSAHGADSRDRPGCFAQGRGGAAGPYAERALVHEC